MKNNIKSNRKTHNSISFHRGRGLSEKRRQYLRAYRRGKIRLNESWYIRIFDWRQGREILLTTESCKIWKLIDNGYKVNEIIQIMQKEKIIPARTLDILHQLVCLKLIIILNGL